MKLTDFLGREYGEGDLVIYGAHSGRSINMVIGCVEKIVQKYYDRDKYKWMPGAPGAVMGEEEKTKISVVIQPLRSSRWNQHHDKRYYVDTRNGKRIDPDAPSGKHILKPSHYAFADGTEFDYEGEAAKHAETVKNRAWGQSDYDYDYYFRRQFHVLHEPLGQPPKYELTAHQAARETLWWVSRTYQPWVEERTEGPGTVSIDITENIVKWEGALPNAPV